MVKVQIDNALWVSHKVQFYVHLCSVDKNSILSNVKNSKKSWNELNSDLKSLIAGRFNEKMLKGIGTLRKLYQAKTT